MSFAASASLASSSSALRVCVSPVLVRIGTPIEQSIKDSVAEPAVAGSHDGARLSSSLPFAASYINDFAAATTISSRKAGNNRQFLCT